MYEGSVQRLCVNGRRGITHGDIFGVIGYVLFNESVDEDSQMLLTVCVISQLPHGDDAVGGCGGQKGSGVRQGHAVEI